MMTPIGLGTCWLFFFFSYLKYHTQHWWDWISLKTPLKGIVFVLTIILLSNQRIMLSPSEKKYYCYSNQRFGSAQSTWKINHTASFILGKGIQSSSNKRQYLLKKKKKTEIIPKKPSLVVKTELVWSKGQQRANRWEGDRCGLNLFLSGDRKVLGAFLKNMGWLHHQRGSKKLNINRGSKVLLIPCVWLEGHTSKSNLFSLVLSLR